MSDSDEDEYPCIRERVWITKEEARKMFPSENKSTDIIKCNKCDHVLISGRGMLCIFVKGNSIECLKCGNKYVFGEEKDEQAT